VVFRLLNRNRLRWLCHGRASVRTLRLPTVTVGNLGNTTLNLATMAPGGFSQTAGSGTPAYCAVSGTLGAGASCNLSIAFLPDAVGNPRSESSVLTDNSLNVALARSRSPEPDLFSASTAYWSSIARSTQFVSATQLTAQVTAAELASAGITVVSVQSPAVGGGTSNILQFEDDSKGTGQAPAFPTMTIAITAGSLATYPETLSSSATNISVTCLNLPGGVSCSYSSPTNTDTITTSSTTPEPIRSP